MKIKYFIREDGVKFLPEGDGFLMEDTKKRMPSIWKSYICSEEKLLSCHPKIKVVYEGEDSPKVCLCELCNHLDPMMERMKAALPKELHKDLDYLMSRIEHAETDRDYYQGCLAGEWPGWEWMKEERAKRRK